MTMKFFLLIGLLGTGVAVFAGSIHDAALTGNVDRVAARLRHDPTLVNTKNRYGSSALHAAAFGGHCPVITLLLDKGANINARDLQGMTPLHWAARERRNDLAILLILKGAEINAVNNDKQRPIDLARQEGDDKLVEMFQQGVESVRNRTK